MRRCAIIRPMLLQTLRHSRILARMVLVWFVLVMGVAVAAPAFQPVALGSICSTASAGDDIGQANGGNPAASHHTLQCVMCLAAGGPPLVSSAASPSLTSSSTLNTAIPLVVVLAERQSPLAARAPPAI
ncbi:MAG: DUF2946 domain-containing protein [Rhodoferax sp.]|nr:MAG: DUF2946 domain-containing protein [Rhodoferax sp.]